VCSATLGADRRLNLLFLSAIVGPLVAATPAADSPPLPEPHFELVLVRKEALAVDRIRRLALYCSVGYRLALGVHTVATSAVSRLALLFHRADALAERSAPFLFHFREVRYWCRPELATAVPQAGSLVAEPCDLPLRQLAVQNAESRFSVVVRPFAVRRDRGFELAIAANAYRSSRRFPRALPRAHRRSKAVVWVGQGKAVALKTRCLGRGAKLPHWLFSQIS
jgi:hypothetical protein